jgi:rhodanese-related sulfurtransferase
MPTKTIYTPHELKAFMDSDEDVLVLDVRLPEEHEQRRIPGAKNVCVYEFDFPQQMAERFPEKDRTIVVYGETPETMDAAQAFEKLDKAGYARVAMLDAGISGWLEAGMPLSGPAAEHAPDYSPPPDFPDGAYPLDLEESLIDWQGRGVGGRHYGTAKLSGGELTFSGGMLGGWFEVDMSTITPTDELDPEYKPTLVAHLLSEDFFNVERYPKTKLTLAITTPLLGVAKSEPNFDCSGVLSLRGVTDSIDFQANVCRTSDGRIAAATDFPLDRTRFGAIYGSGRFFRNLGYHLVFDEIRIGVRVVTRG